MDKRHGIIGIFEIIGTNDNTENPRNPKNLTSKLKIRARDEKRDTGIAVYRTTDGNHAVNGRKYATKGEIVVPALDAGLIDGEVTVECRWSQGNSAVIVQ